MSSSSSYSGSSAVYSDSSRASTPEHHGGDGVPPPANVTAQPQPEEAPAGEAAPEAVAHAEEEHNSDGDDDPFAYSSHNEDMATDSTQDSSDDDVTDSTSTSEDSDEKNRRKLGFQAKPKPPLSAVSTEVNGAVLRALNRPAAPRLEALLRMIVWAQKQLVTERDEDRNAAPPYPGAGRFGGAGTGSSADTNTIARALFGGTSC
ncbi:hypothetical protein OESDEN_14264 [Oesophagostomum dentatum]|uniref:Uncharacterized protein n=1 Tax=Oesophagostomum dentatum TaxID=61180 RepID=A0A0B1SKY3_OESDE|nr:hypothetical protein OESDEN_14264 [Oesophagostomum dentatum]